MSSIKPTTMNTPVFNNARSEIGVKPQGPPPIYHPTVVADCVLHAAEHPVRDLYAGGAAQMFALSQMTTPGVVDAALARFGIAAQRADEPAPASEGNLNEPRPDDRIEGDFSRRASRFSPYTWLEMHPRERRLVTSGLLAAAALAGVQASRNGAARAYAPEDPRPITARAGAAVV